MQIPCMSSGGEGSHTPALPCHRQECCVPSSRAPWAAGGRNLAVNDSPFPDYAKSHHSLLAANVQCHHTPRCRALPASRRDRCLQYPWHPSLSSRTGTNYCGHPVILLHETILLGGHRYKLFFLNVLLPPVMSLGDLIPSFTRFYF